MLSYYLDLVSRSLKMIPGLLGSNALGLFWPLVVVLCGEVIACLRFGWRNLLKRWKEASALGFLGLFICYAGLLAWSMVRTNYTDARTLSIENQSLHNAKERSSSDKELAVLRAQNQCAKTEGENESLGRQNRDQQNTINNCQTEAIRLLQPKSLHWKALALEMAEPDPSNVSLRRSRWLLVTNTTISPVEFSFTCSQPIVSAEAKVVGSVADTRTVPLGSLGNGKWATKIFSPAWSADSPVLIITTLSNPNSEHSECAFKLE
jgi:hypothetical protein